MKEWAVVIFIFGILAGILFYMALNYKEASEYKYLESYCKNVTLELLKMNRSCECLPAKVNESTGCLCECHIRNASYNIFLKLVE